jgi:hypothetical protein
MDSHRWRSVPGCRGVFVIILIYFMMNTNSKIFVWNCRGAASTSFYKFCKQYINLSKPAMLVIMETRCDPTKLYKTFELLGYDEFASVNCQGYAGGIAVAWKKDCMNVDVCVKKFQYIHMRVQYPNGDWWFFTAIYASPTEDNRSLLWNDLKDIANNMSGAWMLAGDFNDIKCAEEKRRGASVSLRKCSKFHERIDDCRLIDMEASGPKFTWRGPIYHGGQRIFERLDRALCNAHWRVEFPEGFVKVLTRVDFSDHHPILISPREAPHPVAPRQFKFESVWLVDTNYHTMIKNSWRREDKITKNLLNVERDINEWKFQHFDKVLHRKKELMARIGGIQRCIQEGAGRSRFINLEHKLQQELNDIMRKEELMWFQRSRAKWLRDGDRNTHYYHLKTVTRRRKNNVIMLKNEQGQWIGEVDQLKEMVNLFYQDLFSEKHISRNWYQTKLTYPALDPILLNDLAAPIIDEEVRRAVFNMQPWKAPDPDGFPAGFYQKSWEVVGSTVCDFVRKIWLRPWDIVEVNQTDICLIPNIPQPEYVKQFRPISLCNANYKIVSKVVC